jgi:heterodisulfide reductase subunit B
MTYTYYPGCSLHATGVAYDKSLRAVFNKLGQELTELEDWNCCGATAYMSVKETVAFTISARNLALAQKAGHDIVAPCSACFTVLNKARKFLAELPELRRNVNTALAEGYLQYNNSLHVRHPLEVLINDVGLNRLVAAQKYSIADFKPACYYGCQIVRPERAVLEDPEVPMAMDILFEELGAQPVDYPPKVRCCGGMLVATYEEVALKLCQELLEWAKIGGANCIVVTCPMCQSNLDLLTRRVNAKMGTDYAFPILYFTQLLGLALGCTSEEVGLEHGLIPVKMKVTELPSPSASGLTNGNHDGAMRSTASSGAMAESV